MIPRTTLYDDYIDQPKLSEQKKTVEYIVPPSTQSVLGTKIIYETTIPKNSFYALGLPDKHIHYQMKVSKTERALNRNICYCNQN